MSENAEILESASPVPIPAKDDKEHETVVLPRDASGNMLPGEPVQDAELASRVPGCKLLSVLGSGGMGTVYLARQENLNRLVAVKVLNNRFAENPRFIEFLNQEALTMGALSHPNIVSCHDVFTSPEGVFIIMEYVPGRLTGRDLVLRLGGLPEDMVVEIMLQVVRALAYVHSKGYIHRDLKPDNLLIYRESQYPPRSFSDVFSNPDSRVMICDFGIAAGAQAIADSNMRGVLFGSPAFMAPEQAFTPDKVDFRADIYALATTACFLLTGKTPFDGHSRDERLLLKAENNIPDPILANGKKPCREFLNVLRKMGAADPEERYQDYRTLIADLEYLSLFYADRAKKLPQTLMKRKRSFFLGLGFGVVGICVAIGIFYFQRYLNLLEENNYVSKTISMIFWEGEQDGWRIFQRDFGTDQPSLIGTAGAASLMLREPLQPGQSVKFSIRLQGSQSTTISLLDEQHERRASFAFYGFRDSQQLLIRMNIEQDNMPMGAAPLATELDWTNIKISVTARQIWFYVNGELRGFRHLDKEVEGWHLQIDEVRSNYLQIKDFFVTKMDNENGA
jgi:serine/threonine protein kinase